MQETTITFEKPTELTPKTVCKWYSDKRELAGSQRFKAVKFLEFDCVESINKEQTVFLVKPITGYNSTTYRVVVSPFDQDCSCQWYNKQKLQCSHILAVKLWKFMKKWNK